MPVIRGESRTAVLDPNRRQAILDMLRKELSDTPVANGPVIFVIPLEQSGRIDVLVVWKVWEGVSSEDRTNLIIEAYGAGREQIAQALGVTYEKAMEQQLLPYAVIPVTRRGEAEPEEVRKAMLEEGAIVLPNKVDLRFPTMSMAEAVHQRLCEKLPNGYWSIVQTAGPVH